MHWRRQWQPTPVFLPGESQGRGRLVGCRLWGRTESNMTDVTQQQQLPWWLSVKNPPASTGDASGILQARESTGVGGLSLLQQIFPTQGLNSGLPHCRRILASNCGWEETKPIELKLSQGLVFFSFLVMSSSSPPRGLQHTRLPCPS